MRTAKQRQDYYNKQSKQGAKFLNPKTGKVELVSDFARGVAHQKAQNILQARRKTARSYENKAKVQTNAYVDDYYPKR